MDDLATLAKRIVSDLNLYLVQIDYNEYCNTLIRARDILYDVYCEDRMVHDKLQDKVTSGIDKIRDEVISLVDNLTDQEVIDLQRYIDAEFYLECDEPDKCELEEMRNNIPYYRRAIMSCVDGSLWGEEVTAAQVVQFLNKTNKIDIDIELETELNLFL